MREDWKNAQAAALVLAGEGKLKQARQQVRTFLKNLCEVRVLDPACGSGNFLYVTLEHLKRLEGELRIGPSSAQVRSVESEDAPADAKIEGFHIR